MCIRDSIQCGRPGSIKDGTYMDKVEGKHPDGRLKLKLTGKNAMSLVERQRKSAQPGGDKLALVQQKNARLPQMTTGEAQQITKRFTKASDLHLLNKNNTWISDLQKSGDIKPGENLWRTAYIKSMAEPADTSNTSPFGTGSAAFQPFGSTEKPF